MIGGRRRRGRKPRLAARAPAFNEGAALGGRQFAQPLAPGRHGGIAGKRTAEILWRDRLAARHLVLELGAARGEARLGLLLALCHPLGDPRAQGRFLLG
ncbi:MAG: hypothetical protein ACK4E5_07690 [Erythrobacter cryptus]